MSLPPRNPDQILRARGTDRQPDGRFEPGFKCSPEQRQAVMDVAADPLSAAVAHGRQTGACACCGRPLSDPESVARGIGPICAEKFFGG